MNDFDIIKSAIVKTIEHHGCMNIPELLDEVSLELPKIRRIDVKLGILQMLDEQKLKADVNWKISKR